jgi:5-methylthioadenosine/S-adenosylhomocysteine deaminase
MVPLYNPVSNITYAALGSAVATVICQGKILMHNGYIPGEEQIVAGAAKAAEDLLSRAGVGIVQ